MKVHYTDHINFKSWNYQNIRDEIADDTLKVSIDLFGPNAKILEEHKFNYPLTALEITDNYSNLLFLVVYGEKADEFIDIYDTYIYAGIGFNYALKETIRLFKLKKAELKLESKEEISSRLYDIVIKKMPAEANEQANLLIKWKNLTGKDKPGFM